MSRLPPRLVAFSAVPSTPKAHHTGRQNLSKPEFGATTATEFLLVWRNLSRDNAVDSKAYAGVVFASGFAGFDGGALFAECCGLFPAGDAVVEFDFAGDCFP